MLRATRALCEMHKEILTTGREQYVPLTAEDGGLYLLQGRYVVVLGQSHLCDGDVS